ncbi:MAG: calcium-binding protein [Nostoc sp.]
MFGGKNLGSGGTLNLSDLNGTNGFIINGIAKDDESGTSVSNAGDINNDGIDDLIIGAPNASANGKDDAGQSYVVFGGRNLGSGGTLNLSDLNGTNGFFINGIAENDISGSSVSNAGDINNDGIDDLIIGAVFADPNRNTEAGQSYVVFGGRNIASSNTSVNLTGTAGADNLFGSLSNNIIDGLTGDDTLTGNGGQDKFFIRFGDGNDTITDFGGVGKGTNPSAEVIANVDTLEFRGSGLTAQNLQLTQNGNNLEVTFENVASTKVTLQNFKLENLDNLPASGASPAIGNILFDGQSNIADSFNVINANSTQASIFNKNTVTFLNDLNNNIAGFDNSNDVINGQGGKDIINAFSGNDLLRGGSGDDILIGGEGNDTLVGGFGNDTLIGGVGSDRFLYNTDAAFALSGVGVDAIADFNSCEADKIILDKTTFSAITSTPGTGFSNANDFKITSSAATSTAKIIYDAVSGQLFYNQNGSAAGFGSGGLFATLTGSPTLSGSDFVVQA